MEEGGIEPVQWSAWTRGIFWEWNDYEGDDNGDELMIMVTEMMMRELKPVFDQRELGEDGTAAPTPWLLQQSPLQRADNHWYLY